MLIVRELLNLHLRGAEPGFPVELWNLRACQQLFNITTDKILGMTYCALPGQFLLLGVNYYFVYKIHIWKIRKSCKYADSRCFYACK